MQENWTQTFILNVSYHAWITFFPTMEFPSVNIGRKSKDNSERKLLFNHIKSGSANDNFAHIILFFTHQSIFKPFKTKNIKIRKLQGYPLRNFWWIYYSRGQFTVLFYSFYHPEFTSTEPENHYIKEWYHEISINLIK